MELMFNPKFRTIFKPHLAHLGKGVGAFGAIVFALYSCERRSPLHPTHLGLIWNSWLHGKIARLFSWTKCFYFNQETKN